ncbi:hypothetical protein [Serratia sp. Se-RSBMAAmG]|uniref:hypothetical protein n=1 Tax=Serratia sp. Se-RSBMAAmG TaxID=3043305 RepID=UPI0024AF48E8|nr:hypothetical protein [Serratia sp. Se-RSBMAAmG]MDI6976204.1 hypothetical protein [Serratia sp. Se-RSBMAAmG]
MTDNIKAIQDVLKQEIENVFNSAEDQNCEDCLYSIVSDLKTKGYEAAFKQIEKGNWTADDKYQELEGAVAKFTVDGQVFFAEISQTRSGSPFTDYYYNEPNLVCLITEAEYNAPVVNYSFDYKGEKVLVMSDNSAKVEDVAYATVEAAIDAIIAQ